MTSTFAPISVKPETLTYELLLTANTALSHHDPAIQDKSNRQLFNRQKQLLAAPQDTRLPSQETMDQLCGTHALPEDIFSLFDDLSFAEFVATALCRFFIDRYNSEDGQGLFSGMERYERLETRLRQAAIPAPTLRNWWNRLCDSLQVGIHPGEHDVVLFGLLSLPAGFQQQILRILQGDYRSIVTLARLWHSTNKLRDEAYAQKVGQQQAGKLLVPHWQATDLGDGNSDAILIDVPAISGNSLRHQVVREPAWLHLCQHLGLFAAEPGRGLLPAGVEAIFDNGSNIASGAKQPSNTFSLAAKARALYPSLDLLGGVTDSFDLGESRLCVASWLICKENKQGLRGSPAYNLPAASISAFDLLDNVTQTRQASPQGVGQMIYTFETLCAGAQVLCRLALAPFTPRLAQGALEAAVKTFINNGATIGGQAARGFGWCGVEQIVTPEIEGDPLAEYEAYLAEHKDQLLAGMVDGTLGTGTQVLS